MSSTKPPRVNQATSRAEIQPIWLSAPDRPLDEGGPATPFEVLPQDFSKRSAFDSFRKVVERYPERVAVEDADLRLTYRQVMSVSERLGDDLCDGRIQPGAVGLLLPNSAIYAVAILGCFAAGRPYVALDLRYPDTRNRDIIAESGITTIVVSSRYDTGSLAIADTVTRIDLDSYLLIEKDDLTPRADLPSVSVEAPAAILYTSGSTGRPKGIAISQKALLERVFHHIMAFHISHNDTLLSLCSFCTIAGTREALSALFCGARLYIIDPQDTGLREIRRTIRDEGVTFFCTVPALLRFLLGTHESKQDFLSVRAVRLNGDRVLWSDVDLVRRTMPDACSLQIGYSSTETLGSQWFVPRDAFGTGPCVPVGYPVPGNTFQILDEQGLPVSRGEVGELVIRSSFVALGQWQNGHVELAAIEQDPIDPSSRIFATGDLVRQLEDGQLEIVSRKDRQIKINGKRVEPAELEAVVRRAPGVADAAIIPRYTAQGAALVAFVAPRSPMNVGLLDELRTSIRTSLPAIMHPAAIHIIPVIPRLPSAKLNNHELLRLDQAFLQEQSAREPSSTTEPSSQAMMSVLGPIWQNLLRIPNFAPERPWHEDGGDSLKLLHLVFQLEEKLGSSIPLDLIRMDMSALEMCRALEELFGRDDLTQADERSLVFFLPGLAGDLPSLATFRSDLSECIRFVPINYPNWREMSECRMRLNDIVDAVLPQIASAAPAGPINLACYSFGGAIGLEVAARLMAGGRVIESFILFDSNISELGREKVGGLSTLGRTVKTLVKVMIGAASAQYELPRIAAQWLARDGHGLSLRKIAQFKLSWLPPQIRFALHKELTELLQAEAFRRWRAAGCRHRLPLRAILFRAVESWPGAPADLGWDTSVDHLQIIEVPGDHDTMLHTPHREVLRAMYLATFRTRLTSQAVGPSNEALDILNEVAELEAVP